MEKRLKSTFQQTISEREMLREYVKTGCEFPAQVHSDRNGDLQHIRWKFSQGVAFDGAYVRVANYSGNNVTKPKVSDDTLLGTFNVGRNPLGVAFDGANIWVANSGSKDVSKL